MDINNFFNVMSNEVLTNCRVVLYSMYRNDLVIMG